VKAHHENFPRWNPCIQKEISPPRVRSELVMGFPSNKSPAKKYSFHGYVVYLWKGCYCCSILKAENCKMCV
jgi:hypothetical protein